MARRFERLRPDFGPEIGVMTDGRVEPSKWHRKSRGRPASTIEDVYKRLVDGWVPAHAPELGPCLLWTGRVSKSGHGLISWGSKDRQLHRVVWEFLNGKLRRGVVVRHLCDVPNCVRPNHLAVGTIADNNRDARERGQVNLTGLIEFAKASFGTNNVNAKLTDDLVVEYRAAWLAGETIKSIVERSGLSVGNMSP